MTPALRRSDREWTTVDEIDFLTHLGTGTHANPGECSLVRGLSRSTLLRRYLQSCGRRTEWGVLRRKRIEAAAYRMLIHAEHEDTKASV